MEKEYFQPMACWPGARGARALFWGKFSFMLTKSGCYIVDYEQQGNKLIVRKRNSLSYAEQCKFTHLNGNGKI